MMSAGRMGVGYRGAITGGVYPGSGLFTSKQSGIITTKSSSSSASSSVGVARGVVRIQYDAM